MPNLGHALLIVCFWRSNTLKLKTLVALKETCTEFCHGRKPENLKLVHFVLTSYIQFFAQFWGSIFICQNDILIHLTQNLQWKQAPVILNHCTLYSWDMKMRVPPINVIYRILALNLKCSSKEPLDVQRTGLGQPKMYRTRSPRDNGMIMKQKLKSNWKWNINFLKWTDSLANSHSR